MYRTLKTFIGTALVFGVVTGAARAETVTLEVSATPSIYKSMFEGFVKAFEAENPGIRIELDASQRDQTPAIQNILRRAIVNDLPDVSFQGHNYVRTLADRGITVPLNAFVADDPDWNDKNYSGAVTESGTIGGTVHGLGVAVSFPMIYYNRNLVDPVKGAGAPFPDTWEGVLDLAKKVQQKNPDVIGAFHRKNAWFYQIQLNSRGGRHMSADETVITFDGPEGLGVFRLLADFGKMGQAAADMTREQARQAFLGGQIAILTDTSSVMLRHQNQVGDRFSLATARMPVPAENGRIPAAGIAAVMLTQEKTRQSAAWKFIKFVVGPKGQLIVARNSGYIPANLAAIEQSPELKDTLEKRPLQRPALDTLPIATAWYAFPGENAAKIDKAFLEHMRLASTLKLAPEDTLASLKSEIEKLLPR